MACVLLAGLLTCSIMLIDLSPSVETAIRCRNCWNLLIRRFLWAWFLVSVASCCDCCYDYYELRHLEILEPLTNSFSFYGLTLFHRTLGVNRRVHLRLAGPKDLKSCFSFHFLGISFVFFGVSLNFTSINTVFISDILKFSWH